MSLRMPHRTRLLLLLGLVVAAFWVLLIAAPAGAAGGESGDCRTEPVPEAPGRGLSGWVTAAPTPLPPEGARLFTPDGVPVYEQWGLAGMRWHAYDLGCGGDWVRAPDAMIGTMLANWTLEGSKFGVGVTNALTRVAFEPNFLNVFDPLISNAVDTLNRVLFSRWVPVFLVIAGVLLLWRATRLHLGGAAMVVAWALLVMAAATVIVNWPVKAGSFVDQGVGQVVGGVHNGINGNRSASPADAATQSVYYAVLWEQWKTGQFGDADSAIAREYADDMFSAQTLTWRQARIVENDPDGEGQEIIDRKQDRFYAVAEDIKDEDPDAYLYVTGKRSDARVGAAFMAAFAALCVLPMLLMSALLIIAAYMIVRMAVMLFPAIATVGVAWTFRGLVQGVANVAMAAVINCVVFAIGGAINVLAIGIVLSPSSRLPTWLGCVLAALCSLVIWFALKPFRRLTKMASPNHDVVGETSNTIRSMGSKVGGLVKTGAVAAASGGAAGAAAGAVLADDAEEKPAQQAKRPRAEGYSAPEPTTPLPSAVPAAPSPAALPAGSTPAPAAQAGAPTPPVAPAPTSLPQAPHVYGAPPAALPPGATGHPPAAAGAAQGGAQTGWQGWQPPPSQVGWQPQVLPLAAAHDPSVTTPDPGSPHTPPEPTPDAQTAPGQQAGGAEEDGEPGIYYAPTGEAVATPEAEPTMAEPEINDEGDEVYGVYTSEREDVQQP